MKIIALGDTHGRKAWEKIVADNDFDKVVFLGDYFDTHEGVPADMQIIVFQELISFKRQNLEKVVLLLGNHDYHYIDPTWEKYTGFQPAYAEEIGNLLIDALEEKLIQITYTWKQYVFIHAGLTKTWCMDNRVDLKDLERSLNGLFISDPEAFMFTCGIFGDPSGDDTMQSPIWVRPRSLLKDRLDKFIQVVGHTPQDNVRVTDGIVFIDCLGTCMEYLVIEDEISRTVKVE